MKKLSLVLLTATTSITVKTGLISAFSSRIYAGSRKWEQRHLHLSGYRTLRNNHHSLGPSLKYRSEFVRTSFSMMETSGGNSEKGRQLSSEVQTIKSQQRKQKEQQQQQQPNKAHTVTVCMVPPPESTNVWKTLSEMRFRLKDPGYYRWPPHVNLLYPFVELPSTSCKEADTDASGSDSVDVDADDDDDEQSESQSDDTWMLADIVERLEHAIQHISPFTVQLNQLGTFGGKRRGVLWLHPDSSNGMIKGDVKTEEEQTTLVSQLQASLEDAFPMCRDLSNKGGGPNKKFTPHMTLSHFPSMEHALLAKAEIEASSLLFDTKGNGDPSDDDNKNSDCLEFLFDRIYLLERKGDGGQFLRVAEIALGTHSDIKSSHKRCKTKIFDPPQPFPDMPQSEEEWVYEERMMLKKRRRRKGNRQGGNEKEQSQK